MGSNRLRFFAVATLAIMGPLSRDPNAHKATFHEPSARRFGVTGYAGPPAIQYCVVVADDLKGVLDWSAMIVGSCRRPHGHS